MTDATPKMSELPGLVNLSPAMTAERLRSSVGARIYDSNMAQLTYVRNTVLVGRQPKPEMLDRLLLGLYAAREFATTDPEYAGVLFDVGYLFRRL